MSGKINKNIVYGNVDVPDSAFEHSNTKIRVTTFVDLGVVIEHKRRAKNSKSKYQTMLNNILRSAVLGEPSKSLTETRVRQIVKEVIKEELKK